MERNVNRWDQAVGSVYRTADGRRALVVAYVCRIDYLQTGPTPNANDDRYIVEQVHASIMDTLDEKQQPVEIKNYHDWPRMLYTPEGRHQGGDRLPDAEPVAGARPPLDLVELVSGRARR